MLRRRTSPKLCRGTGAPHYGSCYGSKLELYGVYPKKMADCDLQLRQHRESLPLGPPRVSAPAGILPNSICAASYIASRGIDGAPVNGIDVLTAQTVIAEAGADLHEFAGEKHFTSRLGLCPINERRGGRSSTGGRAR